MLHATLSIAAGMALALLAGSILSRWTSSPSPSDLAASPDPPAREQRRHEPAPLRRASKESPDGRWAEDEVDGADHGWLHDELADAYRDKLSNAQYVEWRILPGLPKGYQDFHEEAWIKEVRSQIARGTRPPRVPGTARLVRDP